MKLIIDIDEKWETKCSCFSSIDVLNYLYNIIQNGTPIPDNATNGDVLKAIFPNTVFAEDKYEDDGTTWVDIISDNGMTFEMDFWNASYKAERKDNNE